MKNNKLKYILLASSFISPVMAFAQPPLNGVRGLLDAFGGFINISIRIIFGLAIIYFFWGTAQFILHAGDPKIRTDGRNKMIWGVIALFVMVSIYGIIYFLGEIFGTNGMGINVQTGIISP